MQLSRTYVKNDGETSEPEVVGTLTWTSQEVEAAYQAAKAEGKTVQYLEYIFVFDEGVNLYAPNGSQYTYTVEEIHTLNGQAFLVGYTTTCGGGDLAFDAVAETATSTETGVEIGNLHATAITPDGETVEDGTTAEQNVPDAGSGAPTEPTEPTEPAEPAEPAEPERSLPPPSRMYRTAAPWS